MFLHNWTAGLLAYSTFNLFILFNLSRGIFQFNRKLHRTGCSEEYRSIKRNHSSSSGRSDELRSSYMRSVFVVISSWLIHSNNRVFHTGNLSHQTVNQEKKQNGCLLIDYGIAIMYEF